MAYSLESFCPEAWSQIEIGMAGDFSICCLANFAEDFGIARDDNDRPMNILTHSIQEALNSKTHREHRLEMSRNEKPVRCRNCYDSEHASGKSKRRRVLGSTAKIAPGYVNVNSAPHYTDPKSGRVTSKVVNLHIRFGNLCNLKCIMCSPQHSNLWYEDWLALSYPQYEGKPIFKLGKWATYEIKKDEHDRYKLGFEKWWETEIWWNQFKEVMPQLRYIYFTGGEPFLVPALDTCLDLLIEADLAKDITLRFDTNLTVINTKILSKLKKFKNVALCVSVDDTGEHYEFIRFPGKYTTFLKNLKTLKESKIKIEYISSCIGNSTLYTIPRIVELANEFDVRPEIRFLEGPHWLDIRYLPQSAKLELIQYYKDLKVKHTGLFYLDVYDTMIRLLEKYIDNEHTNYHRLNEFVRCMDILDSQRGTNWREILSNEYNLLCRHAIDFLPSLVK